MESFDTNSKDLGFSNVRTLGEAKAKLDELKVPYINAVQNKLYEGRCRFTGKDRYSDGIHIYFIDLYGRELAYYTPITKTMMIFAKPRVVGIPQNLVSVPLPEIV